MKLEELPEDLREMVKALKHGSNTIECDVNDALDAASDVKDFRERVDCEISNLIAEAQNVKNIVCKDRVYVVIHLFQGILDHVEVHRNPDIARESYEKKVIAAYGNLEEEQCGDDEIIMDEADVEE